MNRETAMSIVDILSRIPDTRLDKSMGTSRWVDIMAGTIKSCPTDLLDGAILAYVSAAARALGADVR